MANEESEAEACTYALVRRLCPEACGICKQPPEGPVLPAIPTMSAMPHAHVIHGAALFDVQSFVFLDKPTLTGTL